MTLFKKVFQQHAKPIGSSSESVRPLDPDVAPDRAFDDDDPDAFRFENDLDVYVLGKSAKITPPEDAEEAELDIDEDFEELEEPDVAEDVAEPDDWKEPDLAYVLKQAQEETADNAQVDEVEDIEGDDHAEAARSEPEMPLEDLDEEPDVASVPETPALMPSEPSVVRTETPQAPEETLDLAAFAREQMRAAGLAAAPVDDRPALDLSKPQVAPDPAEPVAGLAGRRAGRVKTRLLGFNRGAPDTSDPFNTSQVETAIQGRGKFPVGWLVVVDGPGKGHSFALFSGASMIGRGEDQVIKLDFGDNSISRQNHAAIAYDDEENKFYIGHGGKSNIIRLNARPVLSTEELHHTDLVRIGETTLRFVALCGKDFQWDRSGDGHASAV